MKKQKQMRSYPCDPFLALHQRLCWMVMVVLIVGAAVLIRQFAGPQESLYFTVALLFFFMLLYNWCALAPRRAMRAVLTEARNDQTKWQSALDFILRLEKALPVMKRKEMAFELTVYRARAMFEVGQKEEALALLRGFDKIWDPDQQDTINSMIQGIEARLNPAPEGEGEA